MGLTNQAIIFKFHKIKWMTIQNKKGVYIIYKTTLKLYHSRLYCQTPQPFFLVTVVSHAGDEDEIFGSVLQSCQFGDLVKLLIAHFSMWKNI